MGSVSKAIKRVIPKEIQPILPIAASMFGGPLVGSALGGGIGAFVGTILLINLPIKILTLSVAFIVIIYITLKLIVPSWKLAYQRATKLVFIMGAGGGVLQGSAGLSAPVSITFLNSMKLERNQFIPTISVYFGVMSIFQIPTLYYYPLIYLLKN